MFLRLGVLAGGIPAGAALVFAMGLHGREQLLAGAIFALVVMATLLFWEYRLGVAFVGLAVLLAGRVITVDQMVASVELPIILFLIGMMLLVGILRDLGLFSWLIQSVIHNRRLNGPRFVVVIVILAALLSCLLGEVTSIVIVLVLVFQVCETLKLRPLPFVMIAVMATNIGSSGTLIGNPVGVLIGSKAGLTFGDFIACATPVTLLALFAALGFICVWYRKEIRLLTVKLEERRSMNLGLGPIVKLPYGKALAILGGTVAMIGMHHRLEHLLHLEKNTLLIIMPLAVSGVLLIWRHERARHHVEQDVEWWTLLFFMMLFTVAGTLDRVGITESIAHLAQGFSDGNASELLPMVLLLSALGSAFVDNIVFVSAFIPVVRELDQPVLWWALLFGACYGGNITMIGSTANIVALGMLEKRSRIQVRFFEWLLVGTLVTLVTCAVAWGALWLLSAHVPVGGR